MKLRLLLGSVLLTMAGESLADEKIDYIRDIKPILANSCYTCHGPDENTREADLRLDIREIAIQSAIVPSHADKSELIRRVSSSDDEVRMPPPDALRPRLSNQQIQRLKKWIDEGATFDQHWAYVPPMRPGEPAVEHQEWVWNPIDSFVVHRWERNKLHPVDVADHRTRIRRLSFDLLGLPPSAEVTAEFGGTKLDSLLDRWLALPAFGERMTAYWLDVVRYGDSVGIHGDQENSMSPYRDYVINAFNKNLPYDQFIREQLAGDLLPEPTIDQKVASAFNRLHMITAEGGAQAKEYLAIYSADRVRNTAAALLGTTFGCAQCHDHKFDPFTTKEFYQFGAFFADLKEAGVYGGNNWFPKLSVPNEKQAASIAKLEQEIAELEGKDETKTKELQKQLAEAKKQAPTVLVSVSVEPREMRLLPRGNWLDDSGEVVQPAFPSALGRVLGREKKDRLNRLDLADWMTWRDNPLVARVFVNRLWKLFFGEGIVRSLDDFGSQGAVPTHPQLLDWLAVEFMDSGWNIKHMVRLIVTSRTYHLSSRPTLELQRADVENKLLARQNRYRLDAEMIRDNALAISGLLSKKIGGPSVRPYQPAGYYKHLNFPRRTYVASTGEDQYRRTLYTHWQRTFLHPSLRAFDAPSREECTVSRPRSNTSLQSLVLLNDPIYGRSGSRICIQAVR